MKIRYQLLFTGLLLAVLESGRSAPLSEVTSIGALTAAKLGLSEVELETLQVRYHLSNEHLLALSAEQLDTVLWPVKHPGWDSHLEELKFRALRRQDEHGSISPGALW